MGSAIGGAFAWLLTNVTTACQAVDPTTMVFDGPVMQFEPPPPIPMVFVGATDPGNPVAADSTRVYQEIGRNKVSEEFWIPCYIDASVGSTDQAAARTAALALYDAIVHAVANDLTLGGVLLDGRYAEVSDIALTQTNNESEEGDDGRRCVITFRIHCDNHYTP